MFRRIACVSLIMVLVGLACCFYSFFGSSPAHAAISTSTMQQAAQSPLINTTPCNGRSDLFQIYIEGYPNEICYANAGRVNVYMPGLNLIKPGANHGHIYVEGYGNIHFTYYQNPPLSFSNDLLTYICMGPGC